MKVKLSKYLDKYDMKEFSTKERYELIVNVVTQAMLIPIEEQLLRQSLKDPDALETMHKQNVMLRTGNLGHTAGTNLLGGLFCKTSHSLDTA